MDMDVRVISTTNSKDQAAEEIPRARCPNGHHQQAHHRYLRVFTILASP